MKHKRHSHATTSGKNIHDMMKNSILTLLALGALASCDRTPATALETVTATRGEISQTVTATGTVESVTQVDVGTQVTGIIDKLYADYNSVVHKGDLIAEIEKTLLESDLRSAEANVESARLTYEYNRRNYDRDRQLHDKDLISDYEYQTSLKEYKVSETAYNKAVADRVRAAKNLNYAEIYSPIDGIVISREVEVGQTVVSSMNVANLFVIADLDNMQVIGNVDEADIGQVKVGQAVTFSVDAYPDDTFEGSVTQVRLNPTTESNVVTYEVVVAAANPEHKLIPGLTANLTIYTMRETDVITLPQSAFTFTPQGDTAEKPASETEGEKRVWIDKNGSLTPVNVKTGASNGIRTVIESGITEGEKIATGYTTAAVEAPDGESKASSPFAPKPPSRNKKK